MSICRCRTSVETMAPSAVTDRLPCLPTAQHPHLPLMRKSVASLSGNSTHLHSPSRCWR